MEKTPESVAAEISALKQSLSEVSTAIDAYAEIATQNVGNKDSKALGEVKESHKALFLKTNALLMTARGPVDMLMANIENGAQHACLRTVMEMGVFDALPVDGSPATATALSDELGVEKDLLVRLMRILTIIGPFKETGIQEYAHTPYSLIYLAPGLRSFFKTIFDEIILANAKMYEYYRGNGFKSPTLQQDNPYTYAHQTGGKDMWEHLAQFPDRNKLMNEANNQNGEAAAWTIGLFPFEAELQKFETTDDTVLLVDIGGGTGSVSKVIRRLTAGIKGKVLLQDRPPVIENIDEEVPGRETMVYDFMTPQPIQGALIYYIRHVLHDWCEADCIQILKQVAAAMKPGTSRLVISECILPASNVDTEGCWMDLTMMVISGMERTQSQWEKILDEAGLKLHKTYTAAGTNDAAIEAYLK